jgi:hypothetical protein
MGSQNTLLAEDHVYGASTLPRVSGSRNAAMAMVA